MLMDFFHRNLVHILLAQSLLTQSTTSLAESILTPSLTSVTSLTPTRPLIDSSSSISTPGLVISDPEPASTWTSIETHREKHNQTDTSPTAKTQPVFVTYSYPITALQAPKQNLFIHPLSIFILLLAILGTLSTVYTLPFDFMPSDPRASSSSSKDPRASSSSSSAKDPRSSSSSSRDPRSSSSSSSSGGARSSSSAVKPPQPTPYISANAWMSFFLFCCLVLIILQGPLGLTGGSTGLLPTLPGMSRAAETVVGLPGCTGLMAGAVPWCQPVVPAAPVVPVVNAPGPVIVEPGSPLPYPLPQMGGHGVIASPNGGGGYSWYANAQPQPQHQYVQQYVHAPQPARPINMQYQQPGFQVQMQNGNSNAGMLCAYFPNMCQPLIPVAYAHPGPRFEVRPQEVSTPPVIPVAPVMPPPEMPAQEVAEMANFDNAFYPLLVGAIALLVIFDYTT